MIGSRRVGRVCVFFTEFLPSFSRRPGAPTHPARASRDSPIRRRPRPQVSDAKWQHCFVFFFCCFFLFLFSFLFFLIFRWDLSPILLFLFAVVAFVVACCLEKKNILFQKQKKKQNKSAWLTGPKLIGGSGNRNTRQRQVRCFFLFCFLFDRDERSSKTPAVKCSCSYF